MVKAKLRKQTRFESKLREQTRFGGEETGSIELETEHFKRMQLDKTDKKLR